MGEHPNQLISAFLDGRLPGAEGDAIQLHLTRCETCRAEADAVTSVRLRLSRLASPSAPAALMNALKREFLPPWYRRTLAWLVSPTAWKPALALAVVAIVAGVWMGNRSANVITADELMVAHSRYQAESLLPSDPVASEFSARLAAYYGNSK